MVSRRSFMSPQNSPVTFPSADASLKDFRQRLSLDHRKAEPEVLSSLIARARLSIPERESVVQQALGLLAGLRAAQEKGWVNQFLQEYGMSSSEGMALLSLAEAFLRVPDPETADQLISDKIGEGDWRAHSGKSNSLLVNSAAWGLLIGRAMVEDEKGSTVLRRLINRTGEPFVRIGVGAAMRLMGEVFVMGRTIEEAIERMRSPKNNGFKASFDMLGEAARTFDDAEHYYAAYREAIQAVGREGEAGHSISVKLSALHPRYEASQSFRCVPALSERLEALAVEAAKRNVALTVDAEESQRLMLSRSEEHTSELQSLMRISYAVFFLKKKKRLIHNNYITTTYEHIY